MELANSIVTLQPGIYILRHPKTGLPPISVSRSATRSGGNVLALYTPGTDGGVLRTGADCIGMQVQDAPVDLLVTAYLGQAGATVPSLRVDKVALDGDAGSSKGIEIAPNGISMIGHIERTGDVMAPPGATLGNMAGDLRLEGFQLEWPDKPQGVQLEYTARIEGAGDTKTTTVGHFCGARQAAARLVGVTFSLTGPKASEYVLKGNANFSGGFETPLVSGVQLSGPSGFEHLTGLMLEVVPAASVAKGRWDASNRTKVFKRGNGKVAAKRSK